MGTAPRNRQRIQSTAWLGARQRLGRGEERNSSLYALEEEQQWGPSLETGGWRGTEGGSTGTSGLGGQQAPALTGKQEQGYFPAEKQEKLITGKAQRAVRGRKRHLKGGGKSPGDLRSVVHARNGCFLFGQMMLNWEEWWMHCQAVLDPATPGQAGKLGREEPDGAQQGQGQGPAPGEEQPQAPVQAGVDLLESSSAERDWECWGTTG